MSMSRGKIILIAASSLWGISVCTSGYYLYRGIAERMDAEGLLLQATNKLGQYYSAKMFPSKKSILDVKTNEVLYAKWTDMAEILASRGGKTLPLESQTVFKQGLQNEVRRLLTLPGESEEQPLADPSFLFGFEKYLGESAALPLPNELPMLIRQLDFISGFAETLSSAGATHLNLVSRNLVVRPDCSNHLEYTFMFTARPQALVKTLNALAAAPEFIVIGDFKFVEKDDAIVARLNAEDAAREAAKKQKEKEAGGRPNARRPNRRNKRAKEEETEVKLSDEEIFAKMKADRIVTDPEMNALFEVAIDLTVYNFGPDRYAAYEQRGGAAKKAAAEETKTVADAQAADKPTASAKAKPDDKSEQKSAKEEK
ncbi:MAG: Amuc_1100 family pilus-like protein [Kiritimatiellae bacterium]|nr:Amuc_1100 family pilus-like protein [Kiritimatiellia bacterium]